MSDPKTFVHLRIPKIVHLSQKLSCPTADSTSDDQTPGTRSGNVQSDNLPRRPSQPIQTLRRINTKEAPRLPSASSVGHSEDKPVDRVGPDSFSSTAKSTLRASIAQLESLLHEAARLAEAAVSQDDRENQVQQKPTTASTQDDSEEIVLHPVKLARSLSPPLLTTRGVRSVTSLPIVKATLALPQLTLPDSTSSDRDVWLPRSACGNYEPKLHNIQERLHDWVCPESRHESITEFAESAIAITDDPPKLPALPFEPKTTTELVNRSPEDRLLQPRVHFQESYPVVPARQSSSKHHRWRKPSIAPAPFVITHESTSDEDLASSPGTVSLRRFEEPLRAEEFASPKVQINDMEVTDWNAVLADEHLKPRKVMTGHERHFSNIFGIHSTSSLAIDLPPNSLQPPEIDLRKRSYVDVYHQGQSFDVYDTTPHPVIARQWPNSRKRFTAFVACMDTACIAFLFGVYDGQVPAMQYALADFGHYTILGNVVMYAGLALTSLACWPLPLLHGRKPYSIFALLITLVLQVPQGLAVAGFRDPSTMTYKCLLLISRAGSGLALGLSYINLRAVLLDCFGASLRSQLADSEDVDPLDVRQHGGGMGMWLGFVSWCTIGPISIGFMVGASIVHSGATTSWGFWICMFVLLLCLFLNIIVPETRETAFRRTLADLSGQQGSFSRVTRGEVKMHLDSTGPY